MHRYSTALVLVATISALLVSAGIAGELRYDLRAAADQLRFDHVGSYDRIWIEREYRVYADSLIGKPELPVLHLQFVLPPDAASPEVSVGRTEQSAIVIEGNWLPLPVQPDSTYGNTDGPLEVDSGVYESNTPYPASPVWVEGMSITRGHKVLQIAVTPLDYTGALQRLRLHPISDIIVSWRDDAGSRSSVRTRLRPGTQWTRRGWERQWISRRVENPRDLERFYYPE